MMRNPHAWIHSCMPAKWTRKSIMYIVTGMRMRASTRRISSRQQHMQQSTRVGAQVEDRPDEVETRAQGNKCVQWCCKILRKQNNHRTRDINSESCGTGGIDESMCSKSFHFKLDRLYQNWQKNCDLQEAQQQNQEMRASEGQLLDQQQQQHQHHAHDTLQASVKIENNKCYK